MSKYTLNNQGQVVRKSDGCAPSKEDIAIGEQAYLAMLLADNAFQYALVKKYGRHAGDYRYEPAKQTAAIRALGLAYQAAVDAWRATFEET